MSKSTGYVQNSEDVSKYLETMMIHAEKHGIKILAIVADMPMLDKSVSCITKHAKKKIEQTMNLVNDLQITALRFTMNRNKKLDESGEDDTDDD